MDGKIPALVREAVVYMEMIDCIHSIAPDQLRRITCFMDAGDQRIKADLQICADLLPQREKCFRRMQCFNRHLDPVGFAQLISILQRLRRIVPLLCTRSAQKVVPVEIHHDDRDVHEAADLHRIFQIFSDQCAICAVHPAAKDTISLLAIARSQHAYLDHVWLYDVSSGEIIDDQYCKSPLIESVYGGITQDYLDGVIQMNNLRYNGWSTQLFWYGDHLYVARDFPVLNENRLGILFMRLDANLIFNDCQLPQSVTEDMSVFDSSLQYLPSLSTGDEAQQQHCLEMLLRGETLGQIGSDNYLVVRSELSGWYYCGTFRTERTFLSRNFLLVILTTTLALIFFSVLFSRYLFSNYVAPLQFLSDSVRELAGVTDQNEFQAISRFVSKSNESEQKFHSIITSLSPQISENFFTDLYDGNPMPPDYIRTALNLLNVPLTTTGIFWVIIINCQHPPNPSITDNIIQTVSQRISTLNIGALRYHINSYPKHVIVLLQLTKPDGIDIWHHYIFNCVCDVLTGLPYSLAVGNGDLVYDLSSVHSSYISAILNATSIESVASALPTAAQEGVEPGGKHREKYYRSIAEQIFALINRNQFWNAKEEFENRLHALAESAETAEDLKRRCGWLIAAFMNLAPSDAAVQNGFSLADDLTEEEILSATKDICGSYMESMYKQSKKHSYQVVSAAKRFIQQNYQEADLSLATVADAINTSSSYLSKIFKSYENIGFTEYLNTSRIQAACDQLLSTDRNVKEIAAQCGFLTEQNFFRVFKRITNTTPNQYRKANRH